MNIYQLKQELLNIFNIIEDNEGEITPELAEELKITNDNFKNKIKDYTSVIKLIKDDLTAIKNEQKRLKELADRKSKTLDRLNNIIVEAIEEFGDIKQSGVKYLDLGTEIISIRNSKAVSTYDEQLKDVAYKVSQSINYLLGSNELDVVDKLDEDIFKESLTDGDIDCTNLEVTTKIPLNSLLTGASYPFMKELAKYTPTVTISAFVDKMKVKTKLEENGSYAPNIAKLTINKSLNIK